MKIFLKCLDDLDDLVAVLHAHFRSLFATALLFICFLAVLAAVLVLGPPDLLAAP